MKRFLVALLVLLMVVPSFGANIFFDLHDPLSAVIVVKQVTLTPTDKPSFITPNTFTKDPVSRQTGTNGQVTFTNVTAGTYRVDVVGPRATTTFQITVTNTTATINAGDISSISTNSSAVLNGYTIAASDSRFMRQSTNQPGTAGQMLYSDGTIQPYWADAPSGSGVSSITTGKTLWVATNGNDGTAIRGRLDKPFLTTASAKSAATNGDTIVYLPGFYLATNVLKNGVNYFLYPGAVWTNLNSTTAPATHDMVNDKGGATTNSIGGFGEFWYLWETNQTSFSSLGGIVLTNPASRVTVVGNRMLGRHFSAAGANSTPAVAIGNCAYFSLTLTEFYDPDIDRVSFDPLDPETEIFSHCSFIIWGNGECEINVKRATTESGYVLWSTGSTNSLNWHGHRMKSVRGNAFYASSTSNNQRTWLLLTEILEAGGQAISGADLGGGRVYVNAAKIRGGSAAAPAISLIGHEYWITAQKFSSTSPGFSAFGAFFDATSGKAHIDILEYETEVALIGPAMMIRGGTNIFHSGHLPVTNNVAFRFSGSHQTLLKNMSIQTFSTTGSGNSNECILSLTNGLTLQNVSLTAPSTSVNVIKSTNTINPIAVAGTLQANSAPGANVVFSSGTLNFNTNQYVFGASTITGKVTNRSELFLAAGSVSAPSLTFDGDPDTGIYSIGGNSIYIVSGGREKITISSGSVAINTNATVVSTLDVYDTLGLGLGIPNLAGNAKFYSTNSLFAALRAPDVLGTNYCWILPTNLPSAGQTNLTVSITGTNVFIGYAGDNAAAPASGEANTLSSLGTGWPLPTTKSGVDLRMNSITNDASLSSSSNANTITFSRAALTGDVTASAGANATTIANSAVTDAKLRNSSGASVIGRALNSSGAPADIQAPADNLYLKRTNGVVLFGAIPDTDLPTALAGKSLTTSTTTTEATSDNDTSLASTAFVKAVAVASNWLGKAESVQDSITVPMGAWFTNNLLGAHPSGASSLSFSNVSDSFEFSSVNTVTNGIRLLCALPISWDAGVIRMGIRALCVNTNDPSATNVVWGVRAAAIKSGEDATSPTYGTSIAVTNAIAKQANTVGVCFTRDITVGNTPAATNMISFEISRLTADTGDTLTNSGLRMIETVIYYKRTSNATWPVPSL